MLPQSEVKLPAHMEKRQVEEFFFTKDSKDKFHTISESKCVEIVWSSGQSFFYVMP